MNVRQQMVLRLTGRVEAPDFAGWIDRHAAKLGVEILSSSLEAGHRHLEVRGPEEFLQALELACSLGPASVLVESATLHPVATAREPHRSDSSSGNFA